MLKRPAITPKMRLDVFKSYGAVVMCQLCGLSIRIGDAALDHHLALVDGGSHEVNNLRPLCSDCHKPKSANEHKNNAKSKRLAKAREVHQLVLSGETKREKSKLKSRGFDKRWTKKLNGKVVRNANS